MIERTLVLLKPDAVQRTLVGEILTRFEKAGLKLVGMKMVWVDQEFAKKHYTEDISQRRGEFVRTKLLNFLVQGPVVALALEGVAAVEVVRKLVGGTESMKAQPGTIRGDYSHMSYQYADAQNKALPNLVHASATLPEAQQELSLWFTPKEMHSYKTVHEAHMF